MPFRFPSAGLQFLRDLAENNDKEWFQANKKRYERDLKAPARALVTAVNAEVERLAPAHAAEDPVRQLSRINRDIRFSKDKTPYNTRIWAAFGRLGAPMGTSAGFYFGLSPEGLGVGAGAWHPEKGPLAALRAHFAARYRDYRAIVQEPAFARAFTFGEADAYKRVPAPYPPDHPAADLLVLKSVHVHADLGAAVLTTEDVVPAIVRHFALLVPFVAFLDEGLATPA
jgi:uncharacterized protein (TIGR02453 family)